MKRRSILLGAMIASLPGLTWAQEGQVPAGYPADYAEIIEGSRAEGSLLVYSNVSTANFQAFIDLMQATYPWILVETTDDNALWEKYFAESGSGVRTADIILTTAPERWYDFNQRKGQIEYLSPEIPNLPEWSLATAPGIYAASADPFILAYNRRAFAEPPKSIGDVIAAFEADPQMRGKVTTYTPNGSLGMGLWKTWYGATPDAADLLTRLGPFMMPETSAGTMREKVSTGEYAAAVFTSGAGIRTYEQPAVKAVAGWTYPADGTPVLQRSVAITQSAVAVNSAKLFLDLLLSREGQIAFATGGQTPYRLDIAPGDVPFASYTGMVEQIGEDRILLITPTAELQQGTEEFMAIWDAALGK